MYGTVYWLLGNIRDQWPVKVRTLQISKIIVRSERRMKEMVSIQSSTQPLVCIKVHWYMAGEGEKESVVRSQTWSCDGVSFRMEGKGEFTFPTGTRYIGDFKDGSWVWHELTLLPPKHKSSFSSFHGHGILYFPHGGEFEADWEDGHAIGDGQGGQYTFEDGLLHKEDNWEYCNMADRRFYSEICFGIKPAGKYALVKYLQVSVWRTLGDCRILQHYYSLK